MDSNHRDERITINEQGNRVLNRQFFSTLLELASASLLENSVEISEVAPQPGLEPGTLRLTAGCSTIELLRNRSAERAERKHQV